MQNEIKHTWYFDQSPQEIWEYLTKPELLEQWLTKTDFKPVVGHKFQFTDKSGKIIHCVVLDVKPPDRLTYSWQYSSAKDNKLLDSKVAWTLIPKEGGTELQLAHSGFTALEDSIAHSNGWKTCLQRFTGLLKTSY